MEQEPVQHIFNQRPQEEATAEVAGRSDRTKLPESKIGSISHGWEPDGRNHPPGGLGQRLEEVAEQRCGRTALVVARSVNLVKIELPAEAAEPDLREEWTAEVEELVLLVVLSNIGILAQVLLAGHACPWVNSGLLCTVGGPIAVDRLLIRDETNEAVIQDIVGGLRVSVRNAILQDVFDVLATVFEDQVAATRVIINEVRDIEDFGADGNIAGLLGIVRFDLSTGEGGKGTSRHRG